MGCVVYRPSFGAAVVLQLRRVEACPGGGDHSAALGCWLGAARAGPPLLLPAELLEGLVLGLVLGGHLGDRARQAVLLANATSQK